MGQVSGMLLGCKECSELPALMAKLIADVWATCRANDCLEHRGALWRATAMLITTPGEPWLFFIFVDFILKHFTRGIISITGVVALLYYLVNSKIYHVSLFLFKDF
jgi:hypothetical protein